MNGSCPGDSEDKAILKDNKKHDQVSEESELKTFVDKEHEALDKPEDETRVGEMDSCEIR